MHITDGKLRESRIEQREIMKEIETLKNEVDDLVESRPIE